jgi:hypothetical protein
MKMYEDERKPSLNAINFKSGIAGSTPTYTYFFEINATSYYYVSEMMQPIATSTLLPVSASLEA